MKKILMAENSFITNSVFKVGCHHYSKLFSKNNYRVFYLSAPISPFHFISKKSYHLTKFRYKIYKDKGIKINKNLFEYVPFTLLPIKNIFFLKSKFVLNHSSKFTIPKLHNVLKNNNFLDVDIILLSVIQYHYITDIVKYKKLIYRITDDIEGFKDNPRCIIEKEKEVIKKADAVIVTSKNLIAKIKKIRHDNIFYLPNGVDFTHFFTNQKSKAPNDLLIKSNKKLIYVGAIEYWFDTDLIEFIAAQLPEVSIVLIGPPKIDISCLKKYKNIHILGKKDYSEIPAYLQNCDIGIIPFKKIQLVESVSPIKLYEYMASGLPVVSTRWKELKLLNSPALLSETKEDFLENIINILDNKNYSELKKQAIEYAKENSWEERFKKFLKIIK